ncbi:hypothetical protein [Clavibacter michiganensis]|uniref:hypothetical protein n=1 Tax=Clavibacter michiganensis TaxID=28447 RepID=UPI0013667AD0|nr:hypothetical protein [Clavibacter michiganensis]MWJ38228.1 hypothetical protein [Clavibacter michiganensis subsp. michiganensis]
MTGLDWTMFVSVQALLIVGIGYTAVGWRTRNRRRARTGIVLAVAAIAALVVGGIIGPVAGLLLVAVAVLSVWSVTRRLRSIDQQAAAQQADA